MNNELIRFNNPYLSGKEITYTAEAFSNKRLSGDGSFTHRCHTWFENRIHTSKVLLTHSCTAALEMAALLLNIQPGDEIIMPSYTFVSTANAFVLRGAVPVFVDICKDTLNIDASLIEAAITSRTKAIVPVHYAGVACDMDMITEIAQRYGLKVIEDAAQGVMARYKGRDLGSIGDFGTYSFHETKNIISGEGGALLINNQELISRGEIIREKGTNRSRFLRGEVDKYTWCDIGSSFLPSDMIAAFLLAQLENAEAITQARLTIWNYYHQLVQPLVDKGLIRCPQLPAYSEHNAHMYFIILSPEINRQIILDELKRNNIQAVSHYVPLHSSPAGLQFGRAHGDLPMTSSLAEQIVRLPLWVGLTQHQQERVVEQLWNALNLVI
ncbi:dTDP-4-amino-4,6-dideoxygalactose transaminase [Legionella feeleii]|uniref:AHBA synthase n=1 Tax=Legionella feeleii TaxID=453 RepID=A0A378IYF4_9GAMM|nr:dTDP-4-amino-4,6-dideoxygalactose transaminase [Legionella feeleii]STX39940.1 AHBA synthase [Legionella feeleii]